MNLIELKDISKNYKLDKVIVKAVDKASFSIKKGEFAAISGSSGSGKSTLLNIIGLIDLPTSGAHGGGVRARTDGRDISTSVADERPGRELGEEGDS